MILFKPNRHDGNSRCTIATSFILLHMYTSTTETLSQQVHNTCIEAVDTRLTCAFQQDLNWTCWHEWLINVERTTASSDSSSSSSGANDEHSLGGWVGSDVMSVAYTRVVSINGEFASGGSDQTTQASQIKHLTPKSNTSWTTIFSCAVYDDIFTWGVCQYFLRARQDPRSSWWL